MLTFSRIGPNIRLPFQAPTLVLHPHRQAPKKDPNLENYPYSKLPAWAPKTCDPNREPLRGPEDHYVPQPLLPAMSVAVGGSSNSLGSFKDFSFTDLGVYKGISGFYKFGA